MSRKHRKQPKSSTKPLIPIGGYDEVAEYKKNVSRSKKKTAIFKIKNAYKNQN